MSWKIGDKVVCINANFPNQDGLINFPEYMEIYTIRGFFLESIYLEEIVNPLFDTDKYGLVEACFYQWRFVKLLTENDRIENEKSIELIEKVSV